MKYEFSDIAEVAEKLKARISSGESAQQVVKAPELKALYVNIRNLDDAKRSAYGSEVNRMKEDLLSIGEASDAKRPVREAIDVTAPFDENSNPSEVQIAKAGSGGYHPLTQALNRVVQIFEAMGFSAVESRQLDDDYHMFGALNFPEGHPARDDFDTFMTEDGLIAPAHTSTMQNRVLIENKHLLEKGENIQVVVPGRCFRNEDVDARHEHTLHQVEGVMVGEGINTGNLIATLKTFLEAFYEQELKVKTQPAYFPFVEPGFEFSMSCPFCAQKGCKVCSHEGWIEILGCGLIHPNVLKEAGIDSEKYTGFAWGFGLDRLVMMQYNVDDIRWFHSGRLDFLEQF